MIKSAKPEKQPKTGFSKKSKAAYFYLLKSA
jgi:hypothetical protein